MSATLVIGPLLRHVDETSAALWVEVDRRAEVRVEAAGRTWSAPTFRAHGHHYALVALDGLGPGEEHAYTMHLAEPDAPPDAGQVQVWPEPGSAYPPPVVRTHDPHRPFRMAFGSCRVSVPHDAEHHASFGVDALRTFGLHIADDPAAERPGLLLLLGDQVYADETSEAMRAFIAERRDPEQAPWWELKDFEEYAELYRLAWTDPATRWLLSTVPSAMIFDDHDVRDDWNTSARWRADMEATSWWHDRIVGALGSYWVHQHLGNLSPAEREADPLWRRVLEHEGPDECDLTEELDAFADRADQDPSTYRWSFARELGPQARLVVVDSRAARVLEPERRAMIDDDEMAWLDEQLHGDVRHLLVGTSLPYLLSPGLHHVEAGVEALAEGLLGRAGHEVGEWVRRAADTEHWAAFQGGFRRVGEMLVETATGGRGQVPDSIVLLSGDVHHSYVAEAWPDPSSEAAARPGRHSRIVQAVCSPIRNPLPWFMKAGVRLASRGRARPTGRLLGRRVPRSPLHWQVTQGPWLDNLLAVLEVDGPELRIHWSTGGVVAGDHDRPRWQRFAELAAAPRDRGRRRIVRRR